MQNWEITKERAQLTLTVWTQHAPTLKIGTKGTTEMQAFIAGFEPLVQLRAVKQDDADATYRAVQSSLLKMKLLGTKIPQIIEGHLSEDEQIMKDLRDAYKVVPRSQNTILERARKLYPVWVRANTALAALTPAQAAITRNIQNIAHTAAMFKALLDGFTTLVQTNSDTEGMLDSTIMDLSVLDSDTDALNKNWYQVAKALFEPGSAAYAALDSIPTEQGTPAPDVIEINTVTQGGDGGLHVLLSYVAGGGDHATTKLVKWQVVGVDPGFDHSAPLDASGNALGPFVVGQVVKVITEVSNSSGTRTSAVRTITIEEPI
ncbi:MAG: hypothetical protein ABL962_04410 [Fimbriimonadaceae bacterium]